MYSQRYEGIDLCFHSHQSIILCYRNYDINISSQKHSSEGKTKTNATLGSISATLHEIYQLHSIDGYQSLDEIEALYYGGEFFKSIIYSTRLKRKINTNIKSIIILAHGYNGGSIVDESIGSAYSYRRGNAVFEVDGTSKTSLL